MELIYRRFQREAEKEEQNMTYSNMMTMKDEKGNVYAEILWNNQKNCYSIRNYLTMKITDYKSRSMMCKVWESIQYQLKSYWNVDAITC